MTDGTPGIPSGQGRPPPPAAPRRGVLVRGPLTWWRDHPDLLGNTVSLTATTAITSGLGFVYWAVAARMFSVSAVGYGSAAVSAMTMLATVGMFGLGTLLIGELPRRNGRNPRAGLVSAALFASGLGSMLLAIAFAVVAPLVSKSFEDISGGVLRATVFAVGVSVTAAAQVFDQATIGLLRGGLQLSRNVAFSIVKLLALPAAAVLLHDGFGVGITLSWVLGTAMSLVPVAIRLRWARSNIFARPDWRALKSLRRTTLNHTWLNLSLAVRQNSIPVLVAVVISPTANAGFYAAWMITSFVLIVPAHLSTVLFAVASGDKHVVAQKLRFTLRVSFAVGLPSVLVMALAAHPLLSIFGTSYANEATVPLLFLIASYIPAVSRAHYIALSRVQDRMTRATVVMAGAAIAEIVAAAAGGATGGLLGLSAALLVARIVEGLVTAPAVISATRARGRHRRLRSPSAAADKWVHSPGASVTRGERQQAGLAVLMAISTAGNPTITVPIPAVPSSSPPPAVPTEGHGYPFASGT